jgi:hypothetical protein
MSTFPPPPEPATTEAEDDLVSAVLDGEATAEQVDQVTSDPRLSARLAQFRAGAELVAAPPPALSDPGRASLLSGAIAAAEGTGDGEAADEVDAASSPPVPADDGVGDPVVAPLAPRRRRRNLPPPWLVAAAVIVLVAVGVTLIVTGRNNGSSTASQDRAATAESSAAGSGSAEKSPAGAQSPSAAGGAHDLGSVPSTTEPPADAAMASEPMPYLGKFTTTEQLRAALQPLDPNNLTPAAPVPEPRGTKVYSAKELATCVQIPRGYEPNLGAPVAYARAKIETTDVLVISFPNTAQPGQFRELAFAPGCVQPLLAIQR